MNLVRGLAGLLQWESLGQCRVDSTKIDEPVCLPSLAVIGEVATDDPFERHPQVPVVVLVFIAAGRCARDDHATSFGDENAGAKGFPARVLEDDVRVLAA